MKHWGRDFMPSKTSTQIASDILWGLWNNCERIDMLPSSCRPLTRKDGYAIQSILEQRSNSPLFGWKIAATSTAGQSHIGVQGPLAGRLIRERALSNKACISLGNTIMRVAEPEFAFRMGRKITPREDPYSVSEVIDAVESLHPSIEIPDSRYENFSTVGEAQLIADNACAHEFILGPPAPPLWREIELDKHPVQIRNSKNHSVEGYGSNVLSGPLLALNWLINELSGLSIALKEGQIVTTGTATIPLEVKNGDTVFADFGALGIVSATFQA